MDDIEIIQSEREPTRYFVVAQSDPLPPAFYPTDVWEIDSIPDGKVEITAEAWQDYLNNPRERVWNSETQSFDTIEPAPIVAPKVTSVSRVQGKLALLNAGLLDQVESMIGIQGRAAQIWYQDSNTWERHHPMIESLARDLYLASEVVDELFEAASKL